MALTYTGVLGANRHGRRRAASSVAAKKVPGVNAVLHISYFVCHSVGYDHIHLSLEGSQIIDHPKPEELRFVQFGLLHDHIHALGFDAFHDALHRRRAEVI